MANSKPISLPLTYSEAINLQAVLKASLNKGTLHHALAPMLERLNDLVKQWVSEIQV